MTKKIMLKSEDDLYRLNEIARNYMFDIYISTLYGMVDAKSLLGLYTINYGNTSFIVVDDNVDASALWIELKDMLVE